VPEKPSHDPQTIPQGKAGHLVTCSHARLEAASYQCLSIATFFLELYRVMKKSSGKADLSIYSYSVVVSG